MASITWPKSPGKLTAGPASPHSRGLPARSSKTPNMSYRLNGWRQEVSKAPTGLKAMTDRLVCADGGNLDPTRTHGKDAVRAKALEADWSFPRHLAGRVFSVVVHGDRAGAEGLRRCLTDWLTDMKLRPARRPRPIGPLSSYNQPPYSTSHEILDHEAALFKEVEKPPSLYQRPSLESARDRRSSGEELADPRAR